MIGYDSQNIEISAFGMRVGASPERNSAGAPPLEGRRQSLFGAKLALCAGAYRLCVVKTIVLDVLEGLVM